MSDYIKEKVEEFRKKFGKEQGKVLGGNAYIDMGTKLKYIESFLTQALQEMQEETRKQTIEDFKRKLCTFSSEEEEECTDVACTLNHNHKGIHW